MSLEPIIGSHQSIILKSLKTYQIEYFFPVPLFPITQRFLT